MSDNKYHIGLCMAGAVSAGAYTAGVMDQLIEALEEWENQKGKDSSVPTHDVSLDVIGGASAGGMTSIISAVALNNSFVSIQGLNDIGQTNPFFDAWVNLDAKNMMPVMLSNDDLQNTGVIRSIFNSSFIDRIANKMVQPFEPHAYKRSYFPSDVDVFVTLSNLVGVPYNLRFKANGEKGTSYKMASYRDVAHFKFFGQYGNDGRIEINGKENENLQTLRQSAMATGAFPFGLQYREVFRNIKYLKENKDLYEIVGKGDVDWEKMKQIMGDSDIYKTINADGGLMNNEPFDITMRFLKRKSDSSLEKLSNYSTSNGSVLMIDPFPAEEVEMKFENDFGLGALAGKVFGAMRGQISFKEEEIIKAMNSADASRYMIIPKRKVKEKTYQEGAKAIACGAFEGFSGFFEYDFRLHDYFLGRYNCRKFLFDVYTIQNPMENPIFAKGYANEEARNRFVFTDKETGIQHAPIIPLMNWDKNGNKNSEQYLHPWPKIKEETLDEMHALFKKRYRMVFKKSISGSFMTKVLMDIGYRVVIGRMITNKTMDFIKDELKKHDLV